MNSLKVLMFGSAASALLLCGCTTGPAASALSSGGDVAATTPARIDNFMLVDAQNLEAHELYRMSDDKAVVLVSTSLVAARDMAPMVKALRDKYAAQGVEVMLIDSNPQDSREAMATVAKADGIDAPLLMDSYQIIGESLGVTHAAEAFVVDPKTWQVVYHGPLKGVADQALDAFLAGKPVPASTQAGTGPAIAFPGRAKPVQISYAKDVAPILEKHCVECHEKGGIGPFAMDNYQVVKGFAPMIRETLRTDRMPPYNADPHVGKFSDDRNLSAQEIQTLVHWVDQGAPRGEGKDPLGAVQHVAAEWPLGKPDAIIDVPAYTIPASGVVDYQHPWVKNPATEGKWLRASTVKVESRQGVHHVLTGYLKDVPAPGQPAYEDKWGVSLGGYAVGAESEIAPPNVGSWIPAGGAIGLQTHYTPFGKEVTDHTKIALYYYPDNQKPDLVMHNTIILNNAIVIPANDPHHKEVAYLEFPKDALLYMAFPHAHYRGAMSDLWIRYPDGKEKLLLSLPRYDFSWQREYTFAEPVKIPAGSKLIVHFIYDNSKRNPHNPDPSKTIYWGDQSWDEMFYTQLRYRWVDETSKHMVNYDEALGAGQLMGMFDSNIDGKVERSELKGQLGEQLLKHFDALDTNHDGVLDASELAVAQKMMARQEAKQAKAAAPAPTASGR